MLKLLKSKPWIIPVALLAIIVIVLGVCLLNPTKENEEYSYADYVREYSEYGNVSYEDYLRVLEKRENGITEKPVSDNHGSLYDKEASESLMKEKEDAFANLDVNKLLGL